MSLVLAPARGEAASLDPAFGDQGVLVLPGDPYVTTSGVASVVEATDGSLFAAGGGRDSFGVLHLTSSGSADGSFGTVGYRGRLTSGGEAQAVAPIEGGGVLVGGRTPDELGVVVKLNENGITDRSFGRAGYLKLDISPSPSWPVISVVRDIVTLSSGKFLVVISGGGDFEDPAIGVLRRYHRNGTIDRGFGNRGTFRVDPDNGRGGWLSDVERLPSGEILLGGMLRGKQLMMRLDSSGKPDRTFGRNGRVLTKFGGTGFQGDNTVEVRAWKDSIFVLTRTALGSGIVSRFDSRGALDRRFGDRGLAGVPSLREANDLAIQNDGKLVIVGRSTDSFSAVRLRTDGTIDKTFFDRGIWRRDVVGARAVARSITKLRDGKLLVGGYARSQETRPPGRFVFAKLNP